MRIFTYTLCALLAACGSDANEIEQSGALSPIPKTYEELNAKLGDSLNWKMKAEAYPDTFRQLGRAAFNRANNKMPWAHIAAATSNKCSQVADIDLSETSTPNKLIWLADCMNGMRVWIDEEQADFAKEAWPEALAKTGVVQ